MCRCIAIDVSVPRKEEDKGAENFRLPSAALFQNITEDMFHTSRHYRVLERREVGRN